MVLNGSRDVIVYLHSQLLCFLGFPYVLHPGRRIGEDCIRNAMAVHVRDAQIGDVLHLSCVFFWVDREHGSPPPRLFV